MKRKPSTEATAAWIRLMRVQSRVLDAVEQDLKKAGFPPLAWYDALLELSRAPSGEMRPVELEKQMLIPQYSTSRLIDRLVDEGLAARRECKIDKRGQFVEITEAGRELQKKMWSAYSAAIEKHVGSKLSDADAMKLCGLLDRLGCSCGEAQGGSPQETARPPDDIVFTSRIRGPLGPRMPLPHARVRSNRPRSGFFMARDQIDMTPLQSRDELVAWLEAGVKPPSEFRIGTEHEKTPFTLEGHHPVPYEGARGIGALLEGMQLLLGWEPIMERGNIIGLYDVTGGGAISLEPGGQFELSGAPVETVHQTQSELMAHLAQVREIATPLGIGFLGLGMTPSWSRAQIPVMPKGRYKIMTNYMPKVGQYGLDMMYRTCTVQTNLDFSSEADMVKKLRVSVALQPVATALFANSPFTEGKPNGFLSFRSEIWRDTDNARAGMMPWAFEDGMGFERWVDYALDVPMYFVKRGDDLYRRRRLVVPRLLRRQEQFASRRAADAVGLGQSSLDDFPRGAAEALSGNARRRRRAVGTAAGAAGVLGRPALRRHQPGRRLGHRQALERAGAPGVARRRAALRLQGPDQGPLSVRDRQGMHGAVACRLAAARPHRSPRP